MAILARINQLFKKEEEISISDYLDERLVLFLDARARDQALAELVGLLEQTGKLQHSQRFYDAILEREKIVSTGIGLGVAIPHAKLQGYDEFFIAIGLQGRQGIEWNALDGAPVRLIFMIGGPANRQTEYLKILSRLTMAIKNEERRKKLLKTCDAKEVISLFGDR